MAGRRGGRGVTPYLIGTSGWAADALPYLPPLSASPHSYCYTPLFIGYAQ